MPDPTPISTLLATPDPFRAWLRGQPETLRLWDHTPGASRCATCPIAVFLRANRWPEAEVATVTAWESKDEGPLDIPPWTTTFMRSADAKVSCADTPAAALALLDSLFPPGVAA